MKEQELLKELKYKQGQINAMEAAGIYISNYNFKRMLEFAEETIKAQYPVSFICEALELHQNTIEDLDFNLQKYDEYMRQAGFVYAMLEKTIDEARKFCLEKGFENFYICISDFDTDGDSGWLNTDAHLETLKEIEKELLSKESEKALNECEGFRCFKYLLELAEDRI